ncbi:8-amino-7-oxononanoate synthase [Paraglaciecola aquimarina]|uniref:8-amino-7-oxononanoate synthase n=1 Tax=Paraglaciecola algarum TaxID=3050085 RepID=A0ABS9DBM7_9ALTE|nr:8-amino-7-oxononanoate synthase [Paraglaciecola sp. G1-23]MCF2949755.1 8-amino-7-oxononanoate synthase [Paraglaciecola sp. G1-23]
MSFDFIQSALVARKKQGLLRKRQVVESAQGPIIEVNGQHYLNFSSNDYLAMRRSTVVAQAWVDGVSELGGGSGASPLVTGYTYVHQALEEYLAEELGREKVLLFNSGFAANQAICQALFGANKTKQSGQIIADKLIHASFIDGAQACDAQLSRFKHNDLNHLQSLLDKTSADSDVLVATESVFSMDGDQAPISDILTFTQAFSAWLMVDDAHGFGVLGETGLGVVEQHKLSQQQLPVLMATFGKAIGTAGAFVAGSSELIDYLVNFARHYIYSTAMPAAQAYATLACLQSNKRLENKIILHQRIELFKQLAEQAGINLMPSDSAIQPVLIGCADKALLVSEKLKNLGLWVSAIRYPTVPKNTDRLRITITAGHDENDIQALIDGLQLVLQKSPEVNL